MLIASFYHLHRDMSIETRPLCQFRTEKKESNRGFEPTPMNQSSLASEFGVALLATPTQGGFQWTFPGLITHSLPAGGTVWSNSLALVRFQIFLMTARSSSLHVSIFPSTFIFSDVRTKANNVALNITVPSLFSGIFMLTRRWKTNIGQVDISILSYCPLGKDIVKATSSWEYQRFLNNTISPKTTLMELAAVNILLHIMEQNMYVWSV